MTENASFSGGGTGLTGVNAATTAAVTGYHEETVTVTADSGATWTNRTVLIKDY
ncbi:MAG: hypothetical protein NTZ16_12710 [Verrucomicrobia bacterium]|nr:hypothetical protein [Verrucomicrobiota bacterium]